MQEYLFMFSNDGPIEVCVKFSKPNQFIAKRKMYAHQIKDLCINPETGKFVTQMSFDEHPFQIEKFEIHPNKDKLIIYVQKELFD